MRELKKTVGCTAMKPLRITHHQLDFFLILRMKLLYFYEAK
jgi:hypothetical protein